MSEDQNYDEYVVEYLLHDPIGNMEAAIAEFDTDKLAAAEGQGAIFIARYNTGRREIVHANDISEPQPRVSGVVLARKSEMLDIAKATCDVFDALAAEQPAVMAMAVNSADGSQTFAEALAALKALVYGEAENADA